MDEEQEMKNNSELQLPTGNRRKMLNDSRRLPHKKPHRHKRTGNNSRNTEKRNHTKRQIPNTYKRLLHLNSTIMDEIQENYESPEGQKLYKKRSIYA